MKVCTDACLFGAWSAAQSSQLAAHSLLDIGCGTGLLSLILAQKLQDTIFDAVEIDKAAAEQAKENFDTSLWKERLNIYNESIQQFANSSIEKSKYDLIISNPPFYEDDLKSDDAKRNLALHSNELKLEELIIIIDKMLDNDGSFFVLLPFHRTEKFIQLLNGKFFMKEQCFVKQSSQHNYFRTMLWLTKKAAATNRSEIIIMNAENKYTDSFTALLKDYYLNL